MAMAVFIIVISVLFLIVTHKVVSEAVEAIAEKSKGEQLDIISDALIDFYQTNGHSWNGIGALELTGRLDKNEKEYSSVLFLSNDNKVLFSEGEAAEKLIRNLGMKRDLALEGVKLGSYYYYDEEAANFTKLRVGIPMSMIFLLSAGAIVFVLLSLFSAYWISKRLTAPLRRLIPAIDRLGQGEYGIQAPVSSKDEYGKVAAAFNKMSAQIERSEHVRRSLAADVAHELRTPLTIVQGKLDLLQQDGQAVPPEKLLPLQDELIRITRLVDDLHQLSLAEAGKLSFEFKRTDMPSLMERLVERVSPGAEDKEIAVHLSYLSTHTHIVLDPNRMTQAFLNLLVNAIRYTPVGGTVAVTVEDENWNEAGTINAAEQGALRISISDNGPGIAGEHLPYIFNRFYRTDEARARNSGGMGLGLAIAKEFVSIHNGSLHVESIPGQGTTFIVRLPVHASAF